MSTPLIRICPDLPQVWQNLDTLRSGFERPVVTLHDPSANAQRFLTSLRVGLPADRLAITAQRMGLSETESKLLLEELTPVLTPETTLGERPSGGGSKIAVVGGGRFSVALEQAIVRSGFSLTSDATEADVGVVIERFVSPTQRAHEFVSEQIPHLSVRFTDQSAFIGPLIHFQGGPCLSCIELHEYEREPAIAVLAAQLCDQQPSSESDATCQLAASVVVSGIRNALEFPEEEFPIFHHTRLRYGVHLGIPVAIPEIQTLRQHPECCCNASPSPLFDAAIAAPMLSNHSPKRKPASAINRDTGREVRPVPADPEIRSSSRARVKAT